MLKSSKHKKHLLRAKFSSKSRTIITSAVKPAQPSTDSSMTTSEISHASDSQIDNTSAPSLPFFEESVLFEYKTKQYTKCIKTIERILKVTPKDQSSHYKILLAAANTMIGKKFKRSHNLLNEVLARNPFDAYALYGKGVAYYFEGRFDESINYFERAIDVSEGGMQQAKDMKIKAQMERKQVRVLLKKINVDVGQKSDEECDENLEKSEEIKRDLGDCKVNNLESKVEGFTPHSDIKLENDAENGINSENFEENSVKIIENQTNISSNNPSALNVTSEDNPSRTLRTRKSETVKVDSNQSNSKEIGTNGDSTNKLESKDSNFSEKSTKQVDKKSKNSQKSSRISSQNELAITSQITTRVTRSSSRSSQSDPPSPQQSLTNKFSSESFKQITTKSGITLESSSEDDASELRPTTSANSIAQEKFNKALDLYMIGQLERSLKYFQKSLKLEPDFEEADEMGTKAQEFIDLLDVVEINVNEKNYAAVVEICTEGLEIDEGNDAVNRKILFNRGLAYYHLGENEKSLEDYDEYERLGLKLEIIEDAK